MTVKTKEELKAYFQNGKVPSQSHYSDLMDTIFSLVTEFPGIANQFLNGLGQFVQVKWNDVSGKPTSFSPSGHSASHISGGTDAIKLDDLALPDNNTDLNASTARHGLLPKLNGVANNALLGNGSWGTPAPAAHNHNASNIVSGTLIGTTAPGVVLRRTSAQGTSGSTTVSYTQKDVDTYGTMAPNLGGYVYSRKSGFYVVSGYVDVFAPSGSCTRACWINTSTGVIISSQGDQMPVTTYSQLSVTGVVWLESGQYAYMRFYDSLNTSINFAYFAMVGIP